VADAAWGQVGDIVEANRRIRRALVAKEVSLVWHSRYLGSRSWQQAPSVASP
jgi:hypothetical protein